MIDTVVLRLHGLKKYETLIHNMDTQDINGVTSELGSVDANDIKNLIRNEGKFKSQHLRILRMNRDNDFLVKSKIKKHVSTSGHYTIAYFVNYTRDFVEFNFSIPKLLYGHNVMMYVAHFGDKEYTFHYCIDINYNIAKAYKKLIRAIKYFFKWEFITCPVDFLDVEIDRIDLCFNQVFKSASDAKQYLKYQQRLRKKHAREGAGLLYFENSADQIQTPTGLMFKTERYSAKIYHKGPDYNNHDKPQHIKHNRNKKAKYLFDTDEIHKVANRMLRYEVTIRNKQLNYLHKNHIFRRQCLHHKRYFEIYSECLRKEQKNDRISKSIGRLQESERAIFHLENPYEKFTKEERQIKKYVSHLLNKRTHFMLAVNHETELYNSKTVNFHHDKAKFCPDLLNTCFEQLLSFIKEFQIKSQDSEFIVDKKINDYNQSHRKKLPRSEMLRFYQTFLAVGTFKETAELLHMSRATLYRQKSRFKKLGITENCQVPYTPDGVPVAPLDLRAYHEIMTFNRAFRRPNTLLDLT